MKKILLFIISSLIVFLLLGCGDPVPVNYEFENMDELTVQDDFSYRTVQNIDVTITLDEHPLIIEQIPKS